MSAPKKDPGSGCLTFLFWVLPSVITPFVQLLCFNAWPLGVILNLGILFYFGSAWADTGNRSWPKTNDSFFQRMWVKITIFILAQIVIIPLFLYTVIYGFWMLIGTPNLH